MVGGTRIGKAAQKRVANWVCRTPNRAAESVIRVSKELLDKYKPPSRPPYQFPNCRIFKFIKFNEYNDPV